MADALDLIVDLTIDASAQTPTRDGFGAACLFSCDTPAAWGSKLVRVFSSTKEIQTAGYASTSPTYRKAEAYFGQNPAPSQLYVAKRTRLPTRKYKFTIASPAEDVVFSIAIGGVTYAYTAASGDTASDVATALATALQAAAATTGFAAAAAAAVLTLTASAAGVVKTIDAFGASLPTGPTAASIAFADITTDPGIADDAGDAFAENSAWYGMALDQAGDEETLAAGAWATSNGRFFSGLTAGSGASDSTSTDDAAADAKASSITMLLTAVNLPDRTIDLGILGRMFPFTPGSASFAHEQVKLVTVDEWTPDQILNVLAKNANVYTEIDGANIFYDGKMSDGQWADLVIGLAALVVDLKASIFELLLGTRKLPFTQAGIDQVRNVVLGVLKKWSNPPYNFIDAKDPDNPITVNTPALSSLTSAQRNARLLPDTTFSFRFQGAIISAKLSGFAFA